MKKTFLSLVMAGVVLVAADEKNYQAALSLIDSKEYQEALVRLGKEIQSKSERADAALYWSAYAASKLGDNAQAMARIAEMQAKFASSKWMNDARALQLEINQASGKKVSPEEQADEDLKLMAIQGLMSADPARSIPLLEEILNSPNKSVKLKKKALFVLAQSGSPKAQETIAKVAKGTTSPELQKDAIHNLGIGGKRNAPLLEDVYRNAADLAVKRDVLHSFMIMGEKDRLLNVAKTEKSEELRSSAVHWLGVSGGREQLVSLYSTEAAVKVRKNILHSLFVSGAARELVTVARGEKDIELKKEAVRNLSLMNSKEATDYLAELLK